jgi:hypothetical protein
LAGMFLWSVQVVWLCSDQPSNMATRGHNSLWLAEIVKDLLWYHLQIEYGGVAKGRLVYHDHNILYK